MESTLQDLLRCADCNKAAAKYFNSEEKHIICGGCRNSGKYMDTLNKYKDVDLDGLLMTFQNSQQLVRDLENFSQIDDFGEDLQKQSKIDADELRRQFEDLSKETAEGLGGALTEGFSQKLSDAQGKYDDLVQNFVNNFEVVGMAGMHYLANFEEYNVTQKEIEDLQSKNAEQQARKLEAERLRRETEELQIQNKRTEDQLKELEIKNEEIDDQLDDLKKSQKDQIEKQKDKESQIESEKLEIEALQQQLEDLTKQVHEAEGKNKTG